MASCLLQVAVILVVLIKVLLELQLSVDRVRRIKPSPSVIKRVRLMIMNKFSLLRVSKDLEMEE